jgi:hypothetical protein
MKLLNIKATLILTLSTIFMVSSVFADIGLENKDKPLIDIESVQDAKRKQPIKLLKEKNRPQSFRKFILIMTPVSGPPMSTFRVTAVPGRARSPGRFMIPLVLWLQRVALLLLEMLHLMMVSIVLMGRMPMVTAGTEIIYLLQELMVHLI